jgi:hypothetical protein
MHDSLPPLPHTSSRQRRCSFPGQVMWDSWVIKWHWGGVSQSTPVSPYRFPFHQMLHFPSSSYHRCYIVRTLTESLNNQLEQEKTETTLTFYRIPVEATSLCPSFFSNCTKNTSLNSLQNITVHQALTKRSFR